MFNTVAKLKSKFTKTIEELKKIETKQEDLCSKHSEALRTATQELEDAKAFRDNLEKLVGDK